MKKLRDYQVDLALKGSLILRTLKVVYLAMEVRTGKSATALSIAQISKSNKVLFITKLKAMDSVRQDYIEFGFDNFFELTLINNESLHKIEGDFDLIISDEHHRNGAYPKPNTCTKLIKQKYGHLPMIFLSGTPTPESSSQWYHQFWISEHSPFKQSNFYKWANDFVNVKLKYLGYAQVRDYSDCDYNRLKPILNHYVLKFTQKDAGFSTEVKENVLFVKMKPITYEIVNRLSRDFVVRNKQDKLILADTGVKLMQKTHQLFSGTVKFEDGTSKVIDPSKAEFIKEHFKDNKIAIFYKFVEEYNCLKSICGDMLTNDINEFRDSNKWIAYQIVSGSEGTSFKEADYLVYYNIDFSSRLYWQSRDRLTTMERKENDVFFIFAESGIEEKIYERVLDKRDYTLSIYKKDFKVKSISSGSKKYCYGE
jgi:hypothetical protein